jgi:DnaJ-class molecular chaperone
MKDYYAILGIEKNASQEEIKHAFKKLAMENHPDKGGEKEKFQEIQEAYSILSDSEKKNNYDNRDNMGRSPFDFFFNQNSFENQNIQIKKSNHYYNCEIELKDVYFGLLKKIKVKREKICKICNDNCKNCNGIGILSKTIQMGPFIQSIRQNCNTCNGKGKIHNKNQECECNENGLLIEEKIFEINIERGISQNSKYIFHEWGEQGFKDNEIAGDLIINIYIKEHPYLKRDNLNLICEKEFTLIETIIGKDIKIELFNETVEINSKIFGILNPNKKYIIYDRGLFKGSSEKRGNLYIIIRVNYPEKTLNDNEILLLKNTFDKVNLL